MRDRLVSRLAARLRRFAGDEGGVISVWALFLFMACACVAAAAVDVTHMYAVRAQMQVAADVAAHSALWRRSQGDTPAQARAEAIRAAAWGMPVAEAGPAIAASRIQFGTYDRATDRFVVDENSRSAVLVTAERRRTHSNPVPTFLFRIIGVGSMNVVATSVMTTYQPGCTRDGFSAEVLVDLRSNNSFRNGFCIHSNRRVELNNGNLFEPGVIVSMPDLANLGIPSSGFSQNTGLREALRSNFYTLRILDRIRTTVADPLDVAITQPGNPSRPSYLTSDTVNTITVSGNNAKVTPASFTQGRVHTATCTGNQKLTFEPNGNQTTFSQMALITNCELQFSGKVNLEDVLIYTTNTSANSIKANSGGGGNAGLWLGREDACATGGGTQIFTRGGVSTSSKLTMNGGQIIALGDVSFAAQAWGRGSAIVSGGTISGTSNMDFGGCGAGPEDDITAPYVRPVR